MARDPDERPLTEPEIEALREEMDAQRAAIREALAEDLGGTPDDYRAREFLEDRDSDHGEAVPDGGDG